MGCIFGKPSAIEDSRESPREVLPNKGAAELRESRVSSSNRKESFRLKDRVGGGDVGVVLIDNKGNGSYRLYDDRVEKNRREKAEQCVGIGGIPKTIEGEQVAAGWPSWLSAVAGEAIRGWIPRRADSFEKLDKIGQGTYSNVYKARDIIHNKIVALKKVRFDNRDPESVRFMAREILVLRRLDHPNVVKLEGLITTKFSCSLYLIFEYMEHDLTGLASLPGVKFTEPQVKCYMHQLISGLEHCHNRHILHRDIKGSNLLIDKNGILKIADFGLASFFDPCHSAPLTSRVVTLWYRPPELLLGASRYGVAVDLWSTGCILGELISGKPIMAGRTEVEQLHKIFKLCGSPSEEFWRKSKLPHSTVFKPLHPYRRCIAETFKNFPAAAVELLETLLSIDPVQRGTATLALHSEFFTTKPLACDPSSLPEYPPSKEIDAKLRDEETRRLRAHGAQGQRVSREKRYTRESQAIPAPTANAELMRSMQKRQGHSNPKGQSEMFNTLLEDTGSGFVIDPPRQARASKETSKDLLEHPHKRASHSGPLVRGAGKTRVGKKLEDHPVVSSDAGLSTLSGLVASRTLLDRQEKPSGSQLESTAQMGRLSGPLNGMGTARMQDQNHHRPLFEGFRQIEDGKGSSTRVPAVHPHGPMGSRIYFSGPLLVPSDNVDQILKEHDRRIQEVARRVRLGKVQARGRQATTNPILLSASGAG